jgi:hypothetical protein
MSRTLARVVPIATPQTDHGIVNNVPLVGVGTACGIGVFKLLRLAKWASNATLVRASMVSTHVDLQKRLDAGSDATRATLRASTSSRVSCAG